MPPLDLYARVRIFLCNLHTRPRVQRAPGFPRALCFQGREINASLGRVAPRDRVAAFTRATPTVGSLPLAGPLVGRGRKFAQGISGEGDWPRIRCPRRARPLPQRMPISPLPPRAQRVAGRGRGWGVLQRAQHQHGYPRSHPPPPTPPHRCAEGGEKNALELRRESCIETDGSIICDSPARKGEGEEESVASPRQQRSNGNRIHRSAPNRFHIAE